MVPLVMHAILRSYADETNQKAGQNFQILRNCGNIREKSYCECCTIVWDIEINFENKIILTVDEKA